jgi:UDP-N-acetylmuramoyl-tripeptide--D-alanyl-D-alanine ligase
MHIVYDALAAITVGLLENVRPERIQAALSRFRNTGSRQSIYEKNGFTIIEDCYNAGPESMKAALEVLAERGGEGRRIAVLGDMLELGTCSIAEHYRLGRLAAEKADIVYAYGPHSDRVVIGAVTGGISQKCTARFDTHEEMAAMLRRTAKPGDTLLFKGSRGMKMETVLKLFLEE